MYKNANKMIQNTRAVCKNTALETGGDKRGINSTSANKSKKCEACTIIVQLNNNNSNGNINCGQCKFDV